MRRAISLLGLTILCGCQRGCLSSWILEQGTPPQASSDPRVSALSSMDCSDGLVRCHAGVAQVSKLASIPIGCRATPENSHACDCPFVNVATCEVGCVIDDVTLASNDAIRTCAPRNTDVSTLPMLPMAARCEGEGARFRCASGAVFACADGGAEPVAVCRRGCVTEGEELDDEEVDLRAATALMCQAVRPTIERL